MYLAMDNENRFITLETKISFQDKIIEDLSDAVYKQQQQIHQLEKTVELLKRQTQAGLHSDGEIRPNEKPPHY